MIKTFSANSLKLFLKSKEEFYNSYILKTPSLYLENYAQSGKKLHALISYKLKRFDVNKLEKALNDKEKNYWNNALNSGIFELEVLNIEHSFLVKIDNFWLTGRFDAVFKEGGRILVYDWKTGKIPEENDMQTHVYLYCASKLYNTFDVSLTYFSLSDNTFKTFGYNDVNDCSESILEVIKSIKTYIS